MSPKEPTLSQIFPVLKLPHALKRNPKLARKNRSGAIRSREDDSPLGGFAVMWYGCYLLFRGRDFFFGLSGLMSRTRFMIPSKLKDA